MTSHKGKPIARLGRKASSPQEEADGRAARKVMDDLSEGVERRKLSEGRPMKRALAVNPAKFFCDRSVVKAPFALPTGFVYVRHLGPAG